MSWIEAKVVTLKSGADCAIRSAEAADARVLLALVKTGLDGPYLISMPEEFEVSEAQEVRWIDEHRAHDGHVAIVAETDGAVIGLLNFRNGERARLAHRGAFGMSVDPDWHRQGVGT